MQRGKESVFVRLPYGTHVGRRSENGVVGSTPGIRVLKCGIDFERLKSVPARRPAVKLINIRIYGVARAMAYDAIRRSQIFSNLELNAG